MNPPGKQWGGARSSVLRGQQVHGESEYRPRADPSDRAGFVQRLGAASRLGGGPLPSRWVARRSPAGCP